MASTQQTLQNELKKIKPKKCSSCFLQKDQLFICSYDSCHHKNRCLCSRCATFHHGDHCDHTFDVNESHIKEITLLLTPSSSSVIQENEKVISYLKDKIKIDKETLSEEQTLFGDLSGWGINAVYQIGKDVVEYEGKEFLSECASGIVTAVKSGEFKEAAGYIKDLLFDAGDLALETWNGTTEIAENVQEITGGCKEGAFMAGAVVLGLECGYYIGKYIHGDITLKQLGHKVAIAVASTTGAIVGNIGGSAVGAVLGTYLLPFIGTGVGYALGGFLGAIFGGKVAREKMEAWVDPKAEEELRKRMIKTALDTFGFSAKDIKKPRKFNEREITKRYRSRAKEAHPDLGGSDDDFKRLTGQMTILLSLLEENVETKREISKKIQSIAY